MPFKKGQSAHPLAGRPKGSLNRKTLEVRQYFEDNGSSLIELIQSKIPELELKDQVDALIKILPYVYPKLTSITVEKSPEQEELEKLSDDELFSRAKVIVLKKGDYGSNKEESAKENKTRRDSKQVGTGGS